jgi:hypothetical protein
MAKKIMNRAELKAMADAAEAQRAKTQRTSKRQQTPVVDPAFRPLKLDDSLLTTYFAWCPIDLMPEVNPSSRDPMVRGRLTLRMKQIGGLREQWDLVGESGWLIMDAVWLDSAPPEQYLICAAHAYNGQKPGRVVASGHLWRLWQPSFSPVFGGEPNFADQPSADMRAALVATSDKHFAESFRDWTSRTLLAERTAIEALMESLTQRIAELDQRRRESRRSIRAGDRRVAGVRQELLDAERQLADLGEALVQLQPPSPSVIRQRLCQVTWTVKGPEPRDFLSNDVF